MEESKKNTINISDYLPEGTGHNILHKLKLDGDDNFSLFKRISTFVAISFIPLFILSVFENTAFNTQLRIPLIYDFVLFVRLFIALPFLFIAERLIKFIVFKSLTHFVNSGIIADNNIKDYKENLQFYFKLKDAGYINIIIVILSFAVVLLYWKNSWKEIESITSWQFIHNDLSFAGYWYAFVTIPLYLFFFINFIFKFFLWAIFLFKVSRMKLNIFPTDPDHSAGLSFLGYNQIFFGFLGFIQNSIISAEIANRVIYTNVQLSDFRIIIIGFIVLFTLILVSPMFFFMKKLTITKLNGILEYGIASHKYVHDFHEKWINGKNPEKEKLLGSSDIQSLADFGNSYEIVESMISFPMNFRKIAALSVIVAIPFLPLTLLVIPVDEILKALAGFVF